MPDPLPIAKNRDTEICLLPALANRHGLITGATGTGKTVTLQVMAERFSRIGVPVFMADVKGDLSGITQPGAVVAQAPRAPEAPRRAGARRTRHARPCSGTSSANRVTRSARPFRISGRCCCRACSISTRRRPACWRSCSRSRTTTACCCSISKDLRAMLQHVGDHAQELQTNYGNVSAASIGAIQRGLLALEQQGAQRFIGEPMLNIDDLLQTGDGGHGIVNILVADKLMNAPALYSTLLLWLLAELYEKLPEVGDRDKPKLVFFFDEAHLLFTDAPKMLLDKIEQVVRLIRSKGVGVYFVTQNPLDVPETVLGQLGNRVQHALRAYTPRDQKAVKAAAETMRANPKLDTEKAITELGRRRSAGVVSRRQRAAGSRRARVHPAASRPHRPRNGGGAAAHHGGVGTGRRLRQGGRSRIRVRASQGTRAAPPPPPAARPHPAEAGPTPSRIRWAASSPAAGARTASSKPSRRAPRERWARRSAAKSSAACWARCWADESDRTRARRDSRYRAGLRCAAVIDGRRGIAHHRTKTTPSPLAGKAKARRLGRPLPKHSTNANAQPLGWAFRLGCLTMTYFRMGSPHYHRRAAVSRSCSGWEGVVPAGCGRQALTVGRARH